MMLYFNVTGLLNFVNWFGTVLQKIKDIQLFGESCFWKEICPIQEWNWTYFLFLTQQECYWKIKSTNYTIWCNKIFSCESCKLSSLISLFKLDQYVVFASKVLYPIIKFSFLTLHSLSATRICLSMDLSNIEMYLSCFNLQSGLGILEVTVWLMSRM